MARGKRSSTPPCSIPGCERPAAGRGWCFRHYNSFYSHGDPIASGVAARPTNG